MKRSININSWATCLIFLAILAVSPSVSASGPAVTVNMTNDFQDLVPGDGACDTMSLPGPQCSLRAAIEELNARGPGAAPYQIWFNIPGAGPHAILPHTDLPDIVVPVAIDGSTQPGASCPTEITPASLKIVLNGSNLVPSGSGLFLAAGSEGSTIRGLVIGDFFFQVSLYLATTTRWFAARSGSALMESRTLACIFTELISMAPLTPSGDSSLRRSGT